jgi:hypothetical protein
MAIQRWEIARFEVKIDRSGDLLLGGLDDLAHEGWEPATYVPFVDAAVKPGTFHTTIGWIVLKRALLYG